MKDFDLAPEDYDTGGGGFSTVKLAKEKRRGYIVALKMIPAPRSKLDSYNHKLFLRREIQIH